MTEKILAYMQHYSMIPENGNIVAGVSGGPDSVCLLLVLVRLQERLGLHLRAVHVNHGLRSEAGEDADFVRHLCREWEVPLTVIETDIRKVSAETGVGSEEAGRRVRYSAFEKELRKMDEKSGGQGCIAVAHNRDDRAETFLFHLFRGTGLDGMAGIRPVRQDRKSGQRIIRPLLDTGREEIEAFLKKEGTGWRIDATNAQDLYTRNRIRNRILPYAEEHICAGAREHLAKEAGLLMETGDFMNRQTEAAMKRCLDPKEENKGALALSVHRLWQEDPFLRRLCIRECMLLTGSGRDLTSTHVEGAETLTGGNVQSGKRLCLPACGLEVVREFDRLVFYPVTGKESTSTPEGPGPEIPLTFGRFQVPGMGEMEVRLLKRNGPNEEECLKNAIFLENIPQKKYTKWFDYDKIIESAVFRTRRTGDYLTINDKLEKKSLKKYMIEERIPANRRDQLMLLADGAHIIWVPGHRISTAYKVTAQTAAIIEIRCCDRREQ